MVSERIGDTGDSSAAGGGKGASAKAGQRGSQDPEVLVAEIEAAREDLAETLDAIADRVSPKRVAERSKEKARDVAEHAKVLLTEKAVQAKDTITERAATARTAVSEKAAARGAHSVPLDGSVAIDSAALSDLPPVRAVEVPVLAPRPATSSAGPAAALSAVPKQALAGGGAALLALVLLLLRRRRRT